MAYGLSQLICMPVIVRNMDFSEVATWNILLPSGIVLVAIINMGMDSSVVRFVVNKSHAEKRRMLSTSFFSCVLLATFISLLILLNTDLFLKALSIDIVYLDLVKLFVIWFTAIFVTQFCQNWFKYQFKQRYFMALTILQSVSYVGFVLFFLFKESISLHSVMLSLSISCSLSAILGIILMKNDLTWKMDFNVFQKMLRYGAPFMLLAFGMNLVFSFDRYVLPRFISSIDFAIYTQAFKVSGVFSMAISAFNFAIGPLTIKVIEEDSARDLFYSYRIQFLILFSALGSIFIGLSPILILFLSGNEYLDGFYYMPFFIAMFLLYGLYSFTQLGIIKSKKTHLNLLIIMLGLCSLASFSFLAPYIGAYSMAVGMFFSMLLMIMLSFFFSRKYLDLNFFAPGEKLLYFSFFTACLSLFLELDSVSFWLNVALNNLFIIVLYLYILTRPFYLKVARRIISDYRISTVNKYPEPAD